ncbi:unnamed protein product [Allacma fusca]|uniref:Uncharacterized protein n=1 Tax=Allacma fusca TaxID=39272 RepID=A0A8J2KG44_9HEXA|nr:unnamed protein product [Allacma fusca]
MGTVPAFALHDKGLYSIPLTLDKSLVAPIFAAGENNTQPPPSRYHFGLLFNRSGWKVRDWGCSDGTPSSYFGADSPPFCKPCHKYPLAPVSCREYERHS